MTVFHPLRSVLRTHPVCHARARMGRSWVWLVAAMVLAIGLAACQGANDEFVSEGSATNPFSLGDGRTSTVEHDGSVGPGAGSYYSVLVNSGTNYQVTVSNLAQDADLYAFTTGSFADPVCSSISFGTADETCTSLNPAVEALYFLVKLTGDTGTDFTITVTPGS